MNKLSYTIMCVGAFALASCAQPASWHAQEVATDTKNQLTIGTVQSQISNGMSGGEVAEVLGSPNVVSTDENGNEVWIYDRFYTEAVASGSSGLTSGWKDVTGGAARKSQSSMTVIIKFDSAKRVRDVAYHKSSF